MSEIEQESAGMGTKPIAEHEWLKQLEGDWNIEYEMVMAPGEPVMTSKGTEKNVSFGGLWAYGEGITTMPDGDPMEYRSAIGYDVSFKQYRGCWFATVSSHLWKYEGELSLDGKMLTLNCVGPNMQVEGETANYRDVIEIIDENHRTLTSYGEFANGEWNQFMKATYTRA